MNICRALLSHQVLETTHSNTAIHAATGTSAAGVSAATVIHGTNVSAAEHTHTNTHAAAVKGRVRVGEREREMVVCVPHGFKHEHTVEVVPRLAKTSATRAGGGNIKNRIILSEQSHSDVICLSEKSFRYVLDVRLAIHDWNNVFYH
jgi:hypothetical protein